MIVCVSVDEYAQCLIQCDTDNPNCDRLLVCVFRNKLFGHGHRRLHQERLIAYCTQRNTQERVSITCRVLCPARVWELGVCL